MIRSLPLPLLLTLLFTKISFSNTLERHQADTLVFSGYSWIINTAYSSPGLNYWNSKNVWVDNHGWLHLKIQNNPLTHHWECAGIHTLQTLGYGTYEWDVKGAIDKLDPNIVLGMFNYSGHDGYDEIDIEIARWGNIRSDNLRYNVWPYFGSHAGKGSDSVLFNLKHTFSIHRFTRLRGSVELESFNGEKKNSRIFYKKFARQVTSASDSLMSVHINFWLYNGLAPANDKSAEVIIKSFRFISDR